MEGMTLGGVIALIGVCCSLCSIGAFFIGRRKAAQDQGKAEGTLATDLKYIKDTIKDTTKSLDSLSIKLDAQSKQREEDYRDLLVKFTELKASYKSLHLRVDNMEQEIARYHHHN